ncbi:MAG: ammonium transporter [Candidatus Omnitrophica bacterium]|nr:ammonium transporter [Candidatus Omnitrophota bacterium]
MGTTPVNPINSGDTAWVLMSSALVLLMTAPGLALFYGGMVRRKNILSILMQCFMCLAIVSVLWVVYGYSLAFGKGSGFLEPYIGGLQWFMLKGVDINSPNTDYAATIPHQAYMIFQGMFAVITPALIIGSFAERVKFSAWVWFTVLWLTFVYCPVAHMVWSSDGLAGHTWGALDFAGGTVVHMNAGIAGLATALYLGKRVGTDKAGMHNVPYVMIGASLLWFGWFGFNAGSAVAANGLATSAFVVTNTAAAAAAISWAACEWIFTGKPTVVGACSGAVAGLVAITPASGFVNVAGSLWIGFLVSVFCYSMVAFVKPKLGYDDTLDAFGVHFIGGFWGALATGLFAVKAINSAGSGVFDGNPGQFMIQLKACVLTAVFSFVGTWIICLILDKTIGMRAVTEDEVMGLDLSQHHERAYTILD